MSPKRKRTLKFLAVSLLSLALLLTARILIGRSLETIHPAYDTTRVLAPLRPDGTVDYIAAINAEASAGVTNANNAAVLQREILGPHFAAPWMNDVLEKQYGFPPLRPTATSPAPFVDYTTWLKTHPPATGAAAVAETRPYSLATQPWQPADEPDLAAWLQANDAALDIYVQASLRPRWFVPQFLHDPDDAPLGVSKPALALERTIAEALLARAMARLVQGRFDSCQADLLAVHRSGLLLMQSPDAITFLVGTSIVASAARADAAVITHGLSETQAAAMLAQRAALPPLPPVAPVYDLGERYFILSTVTDIKRFGSAPEPTRSPAGPFAFGIFPAHFDPILREANAWSDRIAAAAKLPTYAARLSAFNAIAADRAASLASLQNKTGAQSILRRLVIQMVYENPGSHSLLRDRLSATLALNQAALLLTLHKTRTGSYPASLADLHAPNLPNDPFTDAPFIYHPQANGCILYSIGPNLTDDAGQHTPPRPNPAGPFAPSLPPLHDDIAIQLTN